MEDKLGLPVQMDGQPVLCAFANGQRLVSSVLKPA